jgi:hypothetical protein
VAKRGTPIKAQGSGISLAYGYGPPADDAMRSPRGEPKGDVRRSLAVKWVLPLCVALLGACAALPPMGAPVTGEWGGKHVHLTLTATGGTLDYDCAAGTIDGPLRLDADGAFSAVGTHTPGWGGPEIEGRVLPAYRVQYAGVVRGDRMRLHGRVENGVVLGPLSLRRGREPIIFRCL